MAKSVQLLLKALLPTRTVVITWMAVLFVAPAFAVSRPQSGPKDFLKPIVKPASSCELLEFASGGALLELGRKEQVLTAEWLAVVDEAITQAIPRPRAKQERKAYQRAIDPKNEVYFTLWPQNKIFQAQIKALALALKNDPWLKITVGDVVADADRILQKEKQEGRVGECYKISQVTGTFNTEWIEMASLNAAAQKKIDQEFSKTIKDDQITVVGKKLLDEGIVSKAELSELRAVRAATKIFEDNVALRQDIGSFRGNFDFGGSIRSVCRTEAQTFYFFLKTLSRRGLLKHFTPSETWAYRKKVLAPDGHAASLLESRRTQNLFVVDSWHEHGGTPAHVTYFPDWVRSQDRNDVVSVQP